MLIEAVIEKGQVRLLKSVQFVHHHVHVMVDIPDNEILADDSLFIESGISSSTSSLSLIKQIWAAREYPDEYLQFKKLQEASFGKQYKYVQGKTDRELIQEHWLEKYA